MVCPADCPQGTSIHDQSQSARLAHLCNVLADPVPPNKRCVPLKVASWINGLKANGDEKGKPGICVTEGYTNMIHRETGSLVISARLFPDGPKLEAGEPPQAATAADKKHALKTMLTHEHLHSTQATLKNPNNPPIQYPEGDPDLTDDEFWKCRQACVQLKKIAVACYRIKLRAGLEVPAFQAQKDESTRLKDELDEDEEADFLERILEDTMPGYYDAVCCQKEELKEALKTLFGDGTEANPGLVAGLSAEQKACANEWAEASGIGDLDAVAASNFLETKCGPIDDLKALMSKCNIPIPATWDD